VRGTEGERNSEVGPVVVRYSGTMPRLKMGKSEGGAWGGGHGLKDRRWESGKVRRWENERNSEVGPVVVRYGGTMPRLKMGKSEEGEWGGGHGAWRVEIQVSLQHRLSSSRFMVPG
jgi:hypothetical protein